MTKAAAPPFSRHAVKGMGIIDWVSFDFVSEDVVVVIINANIRLWHRHDFAHNGGCTLRVSVTLP